MHAFTSHMRRMNQQTEVSASEVADNPLLAQWGGSFGVPAFDPIKPEHFRPAFARAFAAHAAEVAAVAGNAQAPTLATTPHPPQPTRHPPPPPPPPSPLLPR